MMRTPMPSRSRSNTGLGIVGVVLLIVVCIAISVLVYAGGIMLLALAFGWAMPFTKALLIAAGLVILSGLVARH